VLDDATGHLVNEALTIENSLDDPWQQQRRQEMEMQKKYKNKYKNKMYNGGTLATCQMAHAPKS